MNPELDASAPIGLFDSGLGGLTVLREVQRHLPNERLIYLGDSARAPYGSKGDETIQRYARECAQFLIDKEIKLLIVACNTASSIALKTLQDECHCPVIGTIDQAVRSALQNSRGGVIGVIGTEATIASGAYQHRLNELAPEIRVVAQACPLFVPLVEHGLYEGEVVDAVLEHHLSSLKAQNIDSLILGCTHYPLLSHAIRKYFAGRVEPVECSKAIAEEVSAVLMNSGTLATGPARPFECYVTDGVSRFNQLASTLLGSQLESVVRVNL